MALFHYRAYDAAGKIYRSNLECLSLQDAKLKLFEMGISFLEIKERKTKRHLKISKETLLYFTQQLAQLIEADLPLFESLELLKDQFSNSNLFGILHSFTEHLKAGKSFSECIKRYPEYFDSLYCTLVEMGEESGRLDEALRRIYKEANRELKLQKQLHSALIYPLILVVFCFFLIALLLFYILPSLETLFDLSKTGAFTRAVINSSHHIKKIGPIYLALILSLAGSMRFLIQKFNLRKKRDELLLKVPILKQMILELAFTRWSSTMALLLKGGVALLEALKLAKRLNRNQVLYQALENVEEKVAEGSFLSLELRKNPVFPHLLTRMIFIGENSGELAASFDKLSLIYEENVDKKMKQFLTLLSPIILMGMALIIGVIMLAILIPLTDINSLAI